MEFVARFVCPVCGGKAELIEGPSNWAVEIDHTADCANPIPAPEFDEADVEDPRDRIRFPELFAPAPVDLDHIDCRHGPLGRAYCERKRRQDERVRRAEQEAMR
ncbi:hypothetical protein IU433_14820 [Nocardia puris]|uniref:hypothetical protein n=1 Tax=Nocardia puris TaxID=208602 RepID=UPI001895A7F7|nr:hypothetical protein [Nocardia puris]MBF6216057.1 hypothetical protein [Nocardia puris]MBF6366045.1 hypothetical protein [Nocardia puris]MBF6460312.1 hypothetical protein [Nocardia puris]